jgi:hypothetical protein
MLDCVFCIDFGSAYTKVSLRPGAQNPAALLRCDDEAVELWAPTVVAVEWVKGQQRMEFGYKAAGAKPGGNTAVFTDFKKELFAPATPETPAQPPIDALFQSAEFDALASKYGVLPPEVAALRNLIASARALSGARPERGAPSEARRLANAKAATHHYFKWLRERVLAACAKFSNSVLRYEDIPVRVAAPALGGSAELAQHPGCQRLREALEMTGWRLDERPFVSEPEANVVGVLTKGLNALTPKKRKINFREMFNRGPLVTVLAGDKNHPTFRALLIDVGAFTTDFAALSVDTGGKAADTSNGAGFSVAQHSVPFGVTNLDAGVRAGLTDEKRTTLDGLSRKDFEAFQLGAYSEGTGLRLSGGRVLGGEADRPVVQKALNTFTDRLMAETVSFCRQLGPVASMQELILTGGGSNVPAVREALMTAAQAAGGFVKTHAPGITAAQAASPLIDKLGAQDTRGASALGGASIYFEQDCY